MIEKNINEIYKMMFIKDIYESVYKEHYRLREVKQQKIIELMNEIEGVEEDYNFHDVICNKLEEYIDLCEWYIGN